MLQEWADQLRENLAFRHQRIARRHAARRDYWRWQIERPWPDLLPAWLPWVAMVVIWVVVFWVLLR